MERQTVEGVVSALVFQNEENGYTILRLELEQEEITAVGTMPGVTAGEYLVLHGGWTRHPAYGPRCAGGPGKAGQNQGDYPQTGPADQR